MRVHVRCTCGRPSRPAARTIEDIIKVTVWMKELQRKPVNDEWVKMFPDPASRPARQIMEVPMEAGRAGAVRLHGGDRAIVTAT